MEINFACNNPIPTFKGERELRRFDDELVVAVKEIVRAWNSWVRSGKLHARLITRLYSGNRFTSACYYRPYPIAYGGRWVTYDAWEYVKLEMRRWSPLEWSVAMNLFVIRPEMVPYVLSKKIFGLFNEEKLQIVRNGNLVRVTALPGLLD